MKSYHIITYGCQMNKNDTERMTGMLDNLGYMAVADWHEADLVLLNTCSVRDKAERRVLGKFHELNHFRKNEGRDMKLAISGCMPQHMKDFVLEELPFLDYVVGVNNMELLPEIVGSDYSLEKQIAMLRRDRDVASYEEKQDLQKREPGSQAWVSIMFGCDKFCSYCIVPYTRGRELSREKEKIFQEIETLQDKGYEGVVLLGQNVNSYGKRLYDDYGFPDLLDEIAGRFQWLGQIDFVTSHPHDVSRRLGQVMAAHDNVHKEIHFPIQHGDDHILKLMNRRYTVAEYMEKVAYLRELMPDIRIGTDLIAGFPGEKEEHFENMLNVVRQAGFAFANTAAFSPRPRTKAADMPDQVPEAVRKERLHRLHSLLDELNRAQAV